MYSDCGSKQVKDFVIYHGILSAVSISSSPLHCQNPFFHTGSQPVAWAGSAFPYLLHHNTTVSSYADKPTPDMKSEQDTVKDEIRNRDRTGTWSGPAPRGYTIESMHAADEPRPIDSVKEPDFVNMGGGIKMPILALGTENLKDSEFVFKALSAGFRHIDCAMVNGNQKGIGQGLRKFLDIGGKREDLWITNKIWNDAHRPEILKKSVENSIEDMNCEYLDLVLLHWPKAWRPGTQEEDTDVCIEDTWQAMEELVDRGLIRFLGLCNFDLVQVEKVLKVSRRHKPRVNQIELHPLFAQRKLVGVCNRIGVQCIAHTPLGIPSDSKILEHPTVKAVSNAVQKSPLQVALRWNLQRGIPVVLELGDERSIDELIQGLFSWRLAWNDKAKLDSMDTNSRCIDPEWAEWHDAREGGATKPSEVLLS